MPYASNNGVRIHYEVEGEGPPLVLLHGSMGSLQNWHRKGYVKALRDDYRLVLVDARGRGLSDKPHDPQAYRKALLVSDVITVLDQLGLDKAHFWGYSMGGSVGYSIAKFAPERLHTLIVGGMGPHEPDPEGPNPHVDRIRVLREGMEAFIAMMKSVPGQNWTPAREAGLRGNDLEALIALFSLRERVGLADDLPSLVLPCLIYIGENDIRHLDAKMASEIIPDARFVSFPHFGHMDITYRLDLLLPPIREFLVETGERQTTWSPGTIPTDHT